MDMMHHIIACFSYFPFSCLFSSLLISWRNFILFLIAVVPANIAQKLPSSLSPYMSQHLLFFIFLIITILTDIRWKPIVILICISWLVVLSTFSTTCYLSFHVFEKISSDLLQILKLHFLLLLLLSCMISIYILGINTSLDAGVTNTFLFNRLSFYFVDYFHCYAEIM